MTMTLQEENQKLTQRLEKAKIIYRENQLLINKQNKIISELEATIEKMKQSMIAKPKTVDSAWEEKIYQAYPRKIGKQDAVRSIKKALKHTDPHELLSKVEEYAREITRYGLNSKHKNWNKVPHPSSWFNQQRYELDGAEWTACFREGDYFEEKKAPSISSEPQGWRDKVKEQYPSARMESYSWELFYNQNKDILKELGII